MFHDLWRRYRRAVHRNRYYGRAHPLLRAVVWVLAGVVTVVAGLFALGLVAMMFSSTDSGYRTDADSVTAAPDTPSVGVELQIDSSLDLPPPEDEEKPEQPDR